MHVLTYGLCGTKWPGQFYLVLLRRRQRRACGNSNRTFYAIFTRQWYKIITLTSCLQFRVKSSVGPGALKYGGIYLLSHVTFIKSNLVVMKIKEVGLFLRNMQIFLLKPIHIFNLHFLPVFHEKIPFFIKYPTVLSSFRSERKHTALKSQQIGLTQMP